MKDGRTREVRAADVQRVQRRRVGVLVGTIIGAGVGIGLGLAAASYAENEAGNASSAFLAVFAISTGTGLGIDAAINRNRTVYERNPRITVAPVVTPRAAGARVTVTF